MCFTSVAALIAIFSIFYGMFSSNISIVCLLIFAEVLWALVLLVISTAALVSLNPAAMSVAVAVLCFSAAELANMVLGLSSAEVLSSVS